jgi:toxin ParE1/3/4
MKVRYTETALSEISDILSFVSADNRRAASLISDQIRTTIDRLTRFRHSGRIVHEGGVRAAKVGRFPYLIFYSLGDSELVILHIRHTARRLPWERDE